MFYCRLVFKGQIIISIFSFCEWRHFWNNASFPSRNLKPSILKFVVWILAADRIEYFYNYAVVGRCLVSDKK